MKHKQNIHWSRLLRRALALFLATLAAWLLLVCAGAVSCLALRRAGPTEVLRWYR